MSDGEAASLPVTPVPLVAGDRMPDVRVGPLTRSDFVRYAGAGGDFNPIHHDEQFARAAGMPTVFGMGMLHAGMLGTRLARWVGPNNILSYAVRFTGQVWPDDELTFQGAVEQLDDQTATIQMTASRQTGDIVLRASARVLRA